jgi:chemotaxis protein CheY-P-specific phosphatase CheC
MDLQTRKLNIIQELLQVGNEEVVTKLEKVLKTERKIQLEKSLSPMSEEEFNRIIDNSESDIKNGRITAARDLKKDIASWK